MRSLSLIWAPLLALLPWTSSVVRDRGQFTHTDRAIKNWVESLKDKNGRSCCETADGYPAEYEWDVVGKGYKVRIEGKWHLVPPDAVLEEPNRLGYATVWYWWSWEIDGSKAFHIRCFLPGSNG
jgi:hypothetical protein